MRRLTFTFLFAVALAVGATTAPASQAQEGAPVLRTSDTDLVFNDVALGASSTKTLLVGNTGGGSMTVGNPRVTGGDSKDFSVAGSTCSNTTLTAGKTCTVSVTFRPTAESTRVSHLSVPTNIQGCTGWVTLAGSGATTSGPDHAEKHPGYSVTCGGPTVVTVPGTTTTTTTVVNQPSTGVLGTSESGGATCQSKRAIRIHVRAPKGRAIKAGTLTVKTKGRTFKVRKIKTGKRAGQYYSDLSFKGLKVGRYRVAIRGTLTDGKPFKRDRHFVTCISGKTPS